MRRTDAFSQSKSRRLGNPGQARIEMRHRLQRLFRHARTTPGRLWLRRRLRRMAWPLLRRAADAHRRTSASRTRIVAVVGSLGKSTTAAAVAAALGQPTPSRLNTGSNVALAVLRIRPWYRHAVVEIAIVRPGRMIHYSRMVRPDVVVVTAIASDHNRSFASLDHTRDEKALILRGLRKGGLAVLNGDDQRVRAMGASTDAHVVTFGFGADNDVRANELSLDWPHGTHLEVEVGGETLQLRVRLLGRAMAYSVLAAIAVAWAEGRPLDKVARALEAVTPRPGRLQLVPLPDGVWMIRDDFKSILETIDAALDLLAEVPGRRVVVLGPIEEPAGSQGPQHRRLGARLASIVSRAIIVGAKNPLRSYVSGAVRAGLPRTTVIRTRSVSAAVDALRADLRPGDVVLVKGRSSQRLERVALALQGRRVVCDIEDCTLSMRCERCPMLEREHGSNSGRTRVAARPRIDLAPSVKRVRKLLEVLSRTCG